MLIVPLEGLETDQTVLGCRVNQCHPPLRTRAEENERKQRERVLTAGLIRGGRQKPMPTVGHHRWW